MRHTLKAVFAHRSDAQHVLNELLASGYSRADTARSSALATGQAGCSVLKDEDAAAGGSEQQKHEAAYSGALMHARYVVTLAAGSDPDLERAVAIIERVGAVSIEDHDDELASGSVDAGTDVLETRSPSPPQSAHPPPSPDSDSAAHDDYMAAYRYGKEMRTSEKYRNRSWDEAELGLSSDWETRATGTPAWEESRPAIRCGWDEVTPEIDDDSHYRNHWTTRYTGRAGDGAHDDDKPAYIYGSEARRSEKYRSKDWRDVEPEPAAAWKSRHAGQLSSWENFKDAVNHGWNRISPDMDDASHDTVDAARDDDLPAADRHGPDAGNASPTWDKLKAAVRHGWDRVRS